MGSIVDFSLAVNTNDALVQPTHLSGSVIQTAADHRPLSHPLTSNPGPVLPVANEYEWTGSVVVTNDSGNSNNYNNQNNNSTESDCALVSTASPAAAVPSSSQPPKAKTQVNAVYVDKAKENKCERDDDLMPLGVESLAVGLGMANARMKLAQHAGGAKEEEGGARLPEAQIRDNRETWTNKCEFLLAVIGYAVDLSNVRSPHTQCTQVHPGPFRHLPRRASTMYSIV